jgi:glutaminyl-tRNA synthetase
VLRPLPLELTNWPAGRVEELTLPWWPGEPERGSRQVPFGRELLVEREDFAEEPPPGWKRLAPGREVRLAGAYRVRCDEVVRGPGGEPVALRATADLASLGPEAEKRGGGTIHWVHAGRSAPAEVRLYDRLFAVEQPDAEEDFLRALNPGSLQRAPEARIEPALAAAAPGSRYQFLRLGYFFAITLKDTWARPAARPEPRRAAPPPTPSAAGRSQAELLASDPAVSAYLRQAVAAGAAEPSAARWLVNELLGLARGTPLPALPLPGAAFGRFVALVDAGKVTPAGAKALLADLVAGGGEPAERLAALGLARVDDRAAVAAAVARALDAQAPQVERYRGGEKKLLGVLLGAAMRETGGKADAALVRQLLLERLG